MSPRAGTMSAMKKVGICMPVANEETTIRPFLDDLLRNLDGFPYDPTVYVIMDNFSRDGTQAVVEALAARDPRIRLIFFPGSTGVVSCYLHGFKVALDEGCDYIIEMDSGGSHPPGKLPEMLVALDQEGYDVVLMSRFLPGGGMENLPAYRRFISKGGTWLANLWLRLNLSDATSGFEGFRAEVLAAMDLDAFLSWGGIYQTEMKYYCSVQGCRIKVLPFTYVGTTTSFRLKWLWIALKTLYRIKRHASCVLTPASVPPGNR